MSQWHPIPLIISICLLPQTLWGFKTPDIEMVTFSGVNTHPIFVSNSSFVYLSRDPKKHKDTQIYFRDLKSDKKKQISHQRGHLSNGSYSSENQKLYYSSTTDEDKESPYILKPQLKRFPSTVKNDSFFHINFSPQEIYQSHIDGTQVKRVTKNPGYDGFPSFVKKRNRIYFSRWHNKRMTLFAKSLDKKLAPWSITQTHGHDLGLHLSRDENQWVWSRFSPDFKSSQIMVSDLDFTTPQYVTLNEGLQWSPVWHPSGKSIIFSSKNSQTQGFDLYEAKTDGACQRRLTQFAGDEFFPSVSPDGQYILFTSTQSGQEQIYKMKALPPWDCSSSSHKDQL